MRFDLYDLFGFIERTARITSAVIRHDGISVSEVVDEAVIAFRVAASGGGS